MNSKFSNNIYYQSQPSKHNKLSEALRKYPEVIWASYLNNNFTIIINRSLSQRMRNKRFPISKAILSSFSYRFLVHDNANKTKRRKLSEVKFVNSLVRLFVVPSEGRRKNDFNFEETFWVWVELFMIFHRKKFWKRKSFPRARPENPAFFTTGTQLLLHDSVIYDDDHPTSSFRESERTKHQQQQSSEQQSFHLRCFNIFQGDRMFTPEKDGKQKQKKIVKK